MLMSPDSLLQEWKQQVNRVLMPFLNQPTMEGEKQAEKNLRILLKEYKDAAKKERFEALFKEQGIPEAVDIISKETEAIWRSHVDGEYQGLNGGKQGKDAYRLYLSQCEGCCRMMEYAISLYEEKYDTRRIPLYRSIRMMAQRCLDTRGTEVKKPLLGKETITEIPVPTDVQKTMTKRMELCDSQEEAIRKHNSGIGGVLHNAIRGNIRK